MLYCPLLVVSVRSYLLICAMHDQDNTSEEDELFFDMLKDEFAFFYALTVAVMDVLKDLKKSDEDACR